jgi:mutator protein MutT
MPNKVTRVLAAVIRRNGRLLLCQRPSHKRHGGFWEFPGGKLLEGESYEDAAHHELREELGVPVVSVGTVCFSQADPGSEFVIDFVEVEIDGEPQALEHQTLQWALPNQIGHFPMPPSDRAFANVFFADEIGESHGKA